MENRAILPEEAIEKGRQSALYRRLILNEWAELAPGEVELTKAQDSAAHAFLDEVLGGDLPDAVAILGFTLINSGNDFQTNLAGVRRMVLRSL